MALNFPDSPTNGQKYTDATTGETWTYESSTNSWTSDGLTTAVGIQYKGGIDITAAPPAGVANGWQYTVTTGGTANAGFTGLSGNIPAGTTILYDGANWQQAGAGVKWNRTGTELSPVNAGDSVFTSGAVKVGGTTAAPNLQIKADGGIVANTDGLVYDAATKRLGLGSSSPLSQLSNVSSNGSLSSANSTGIAWQSTANEWAGVISSRPTSGNSYALRAHTEGTTSSDYIFHGSSGSGTGTSRFVITGAGAVGIGITGIGTTPSYKLDVNTGSNDRVRIVDGASATLELERTGAKSFLIQSTDDSGLRIYDEDAGSERCRVDTSGRFLVGTSSDSGGALLQVNGNRIRVATAKTPASASDTGTAGEICWDASNIYVCTATNTWKRTAISTW